MFRFTGLFSETKGYARNILFSETKGYARNIRLKKIIKR